MSFGVFAAMSVSRVIQVSNITPSATKQQMQELFSYLGIVEDLTLYPDPSVHFAHAPYSLLSVIFRCFSNTSAAPVSSRACFVQYRDPESCSVALHLTNTVFIDRALIVVPVAAGTLDEMSRTEIYMNVLLGDNKFM